MRNRRIPGILAGAAFIVAAGAAAAGDDPLPALIRAQTDAFSAASDRQDQAAIDRLLDADVLFSGGSGEVDRDAARDKSDSVSVLLRQYTQAMRDAGQRGDAATLGRYLDERILFVDEDGRVAAGRRKVRGDAPAVPPGSKSARVTIADWVLHHSGDVAVSSYVDEQTVDYGGQAVNYRFLAVDSWIKRGRQWKLVGSETIPLHQNPPAAGLSEQALDDYVGHYSDGAGLTVSVTRDGSGLLASTNGDKATPLAAEARDLFFRPDANPGYARRPIIFRRDGNGRIAYYLSRSLVLARTDSAAANSDPAAALPGVPPSLTLRDFVLHGSGDIAVATFLHDRVSDFHGHAIHTTFRSMETWVRRGREWKMIASQGRELQADPPAANIAPQDLDDYVGSFAAGPGLTVSIARDGGALSASVNGARPVALTPEVDDVFFVPGWPRTRIIFQRGADRRVSGYLSRRDERDLMFSRI